MKKNWSGLFSSKQRNIKQYITEPTLILAFMNINFIVNSDSVFIKYNLKNLLRYNSQESNLIPMTM